MLTSSIQDEDILSTTQAVRRIALALSAVIGLAMASDLAPRSALAASPPGSFNGEAYGTFTTAVAGPIAATLGKTAYLPCPCQGTNGQTRTNTINSLSAGIGGNVLTADVVTSTVRTDRTGDTAEATVTNTITGLNLLNGLITATTVKAVANTTADAQTITSNADGSTFVGLTIAGQSIVANPAPNTRIALPGVGAVVLNKRKITGNGQQQRKITVEMLTVEVNVANAFSLPVGARIVVAHAAGGFTRMNLPFLVNGQAYAAMANAAIGSQIQNRIGKAALVTVGCVGTNGQIKRNNIAALEVGTVLNIGAGETTAFGGRDGNGTIARTTARVENASLLNGLITFNAINVVAEDRYDGRRHTRSTAGTSFVGLRVLGQNIPVNVAPNTRIDLPLLGYVILNEQKLPVGRGETLVNGLRIVVTLDNPLLNLPVGSQIIVAHADANANLQR